MKLASVLPILAVVIAGPLVAQAGPGQNRAALQRQIVERMIANFANQAALTEDQRTQVREAIGQSFARRRELQGVQRALILGLEQQMRPGVAADEDSLLTLIDAITQSKQDLVDLGKADQARFATFLNPIQQAQLVLMLERFERQVQNQLRRRLAGNPTARRER